MNDKRIVLTQILDTEGLENSVEPQMLIDHSPTQAIQRIEQKVNEFSTEQIRSRNSQDEARMKRLTDMLNKKKEGNQNNNENPI